MTWLTVIYVQCNISFTNDHGYVSLAVNSPLSFPHSWLITRFITRLTRWVPFVVQELLTLPEHLTSSPVFSVVRVIRSLVLCVCFVDRFCLFVFFNSVLSVLRFTDSDYSFGIFKLSLLARFNTASYTLNHHV